MATRIEELADSIGSKAGLIGTYLRSNNLPCPSFDVDGPVDPVLAESEAEQARNDAMAACLELFDLLQGPQMCLRPCLNGAPLHIIYKYQLAQKVPLRGMISFSDLAASCGMYETDLRSVIRFAITFHRCFQEPVHGMVSHSAASRQLAERSDVQAGVGYMFDGNYQSFARLYDAIESGKGKSKAIDQAAWSLARGSHASFFDDLDTNQDLADRFQGAMRFFMKTTGHDPMLLVDHYDWAKLSSGSTVVDVGGGDGSVAKILAGALPGLVFVVQDQARIIELAQQSNDLPMNVKLQVSDFFQPQQVIGAQVYLLRWVLHDWPDNYALQIIRALVPAMTKGSRVVINDYVGPGQAGKLPLLPERFMRELDMVMLANHNAYERELGDWQKLFEEADAGFGSVKCIRLPMTMMAVLEVEWDA